MNLQEMRNSYGLTQKELGEAVGVSQVAISHFETGKEKPKPEIAKRIGDCFGIGITDVWHMFYESSESPESEIE